jgi:hypothetical protein
MLLISTLLFIADAKASIEMEEEEGTAEKRRKENN